MNLWLWAAVAICLCLVPAGIVVFRGNLGDRLVGLEMGASLTVIELLLLTEGFRRPSFLDLPLTLTLLGFGSAMVFARFLQRWL
jgi:multicomponent Na+:H+ antiporter subunit F